MPEKIVQLNEEIIKGQLKELVRGSVEETLNELLEKVPTWTQAELQALSDQQLDEELYFIIDLSDSGWDSNTLSKYSREVINTIVAQHPQFAYGSFRSSEKHLEFYRSDIATEKKRRQDIKEEEKDQQEAQDAVNAPEVQKLLEQAIVSGTCETYQITLTGYTDGAIQLACKNMKTPGYTFSGYTYAASSTTSDYNVTAKTGGIVAITNYKWGRNETQRYIDQIEEAIRNGRQRIELQPGELSRQKTCAYVWTVLIGYWAMKEEARKIG